MRVRTRIATIGLALGLLAILSPASAGAAGSFVLIAHSRAGG